MSTAVETPPTLSNSNQLICVETIASTVSNECAMSVQPPSRPSSLHEISAHSGSSLPECIANALYNGRAHLECFDRE